MRIIKSAPVRRLLAVRQRSDGGFFLKRRERKAVRALLAYSLSAHRPIVPADLKRDELKI